jgi:hypothetical protein
MARSRRDRPRTVHNLHIQSGRHGAIREGMAHMRSVVFCPHVLLLQRILTHKTCHALSSLGVLLPPGVIRPGKSCSLVQNAGNICTNAYKSAYETYVLWTSKHRPELSKNHVTPCITHTTLKRAGPKSWPDHGGTNPGTCPTTKT